MNLGMAGAAAAAVFDVPGRVVVGRIGAAAGRPTAGDGDAPVALERPVSMEGPVELTVGTPAPFTAAPEIGPLGTAVPEMAAALRWAEPVLDIPEGSLLLGAPSAVRDADNTGNRGPTWTATSCWGQYHRVAPTPTRTAATTATRSMRRPLLMITGPVERGRSDGQTIDQPAHRGDPAHQDQ